MAVTDKAAVDSSHNKLPLPTLCFVALGLPTFYMPLAYFALAVWVIGGMLAGDLGDLPDWLANPVIPPLAVTFCMWPVYIVWVAISRRLTWKEKAWWLFIVLLMNMVGMPIFFVFMVRRYLGLEGRPNKRDELSLVRFLQRHSLSRERFSTDQLSVLRSHCRDRRQGRWAALVTIPLTALMLYSAFVVFPRVFLPIFSDLTPTRTIIVDSVAQTREEISPDPETQKLHTQLVMIFGATAGAMATASLLLLAVTIPQVCGTREQRTLIEFVKATGSQRADNVCDGSPRDRL